MKVGFLGYGKMGKAIEALAAQAGHETVLRIDAQSAGSRTPENLRACDVVFEFSRPEIAYEHLRLALESGVPVVSGTTGWLDRFEEIRRLCKDRGGSLFYASNFSIGVNLFFAVNRYLARLMNDHASYEVSIREIHHVHKLDAPSGTAITLADILIGELDRKRSWVVGEAGAPEELAIDADRVGEVPGTHEVVYHSPVDTLTLRHDAHTREGFARGALLAAEWLIGRKGVFGMEDMLGF